MNASFLFLLLGNLAIFLAPVASKHHEHHHSDSEEVHGGGASLHSGSHEMGFHSAGADIKDAVVPKQLSISLFEHVSPFRFKPEKLLVFNHERYEPWSNWSSCIVKDCIEIRYRTCVDESWKQRSSSKIHTSNCLSKYYAEKRTCENKTLCNSYVIPEKLSELCGVKPELPAIAPKIIGGQVTAPHAWPWAVRLSIKVPGQNPVSFCSGTLVAPQWVLTAAHCLLVENKRMPVGRMVTLRNEMRSALYVHFGDHDKRKKEKSQQDIRAEKAILHPRYHRKLMADGDDIALIYLPKPVKLSPEVGYACLPTKDLLLEPGTKCYAVGWGSTNAGRTPTFDDISSILDAMFLPSTPFRPPLFSRPFGMSPFTRAHSDDRQSTSSVLREVELPIVGIKECTKYYQDLNEDVHVCAGQRGKDTCTGDSGGGLFCQIPKSGRWFTAGVTSFGLAKGCGAHPGVYTSVPGHLEWITQTMASSPY